MHGLNALVVEAEYLVAADIEQSLRAAGAAGVTIEDDTERARRLDFSAFGVAVIDAKFGSADAIALCDALRAARVPVVVTSADHGVHALFSGAVPLPKPFDSAALLAACDAARRRDTSLPRNDTLPPDPLGEAG